MSRKATILTTALAAVTVTSVAFAGNAFKQQAEAEMEMIKMFHVIMDLVQTSAEVADSETASGVAAVFAIEDYLGNGEEAIEFFEERVDETESDAIRRAVRIKLSELYEQNGRSDDAVEQLAILIDAED